MNIPRAFVVELEGEGRGRGEEGEREGAGTEMETETETEREKKIEKKGNEEQEGKLRRRRWEAKLIGHRREIEDFKSRFKDGKRGSSCLK